MMPVMRWSPAAIWAATSPATTIWRACCLELLAWLDVDHHLLAQARGLEQRAGGVHIFAGIVGRLAAARRMTWQSSLPRVSKMAAWPILVMPMKAWVARGQDGVGGDLHAAVGAVLEAHRALETAGQLAVALALGGARRQWRPSSPVR